MDQNEHQTSIKSTKYQFIKTFLQFLISISLFSLLISYPSGLYFFYHSIYFHFRKFIYPLFIHDIERKYMFLICNGLLAFVLRNLSSSSSSRVGSEYNISEDGKSASELSETKAPVVNKRAAIENVVLVAEEEAEDEEEEEEDGSLNTEAGEIGALVIEEEEDKLLIAEEEEEAGAVNRGEREGEEEEEGNEELLTTEELNKKFDEFIRKMKEELRFDAQRQPIAV